MQLGYGVYSEVWRVKGQEAKIIVSHCGDKRLNCSDTSHFLASPSSCFTIITTGCGGNIRERDDLALRLHTFFRKVLVSNILTEVSIVFLLTLKANAALGH
jgi:hypothetical protein